MGPDGPKMRAVTQQAVLEILTLAFEVLHQPCSRCDGLPRRRQTVGAQAAASSEDIAALVVLGEVQAHGLLFLGDAQTDDRVDDE